MNPLVQDHLDASARNLTIARRMLGHFDSGVSPTHDDWVITVTFYSALHIVDAYILQVLNETPNSHKDRDRIVRHHPVLSSISADYRILKNLSQTARYHPLATFEPYEVQKAFDIVYQIRQTITPTLENA